MRGRDRGGSVSSIFKKFSKCQNIVLITFENAFLSQLFVMQIFHLQFNKKIKNLSSST